MRTTARLLGNVAAFLATAALFGSAAWAHPYTTSLGVENTFLDPVGWDAGDPDSTYQEWDRKTKPVTPGDPEVDNPPDHGYSTNPAIATQPMHRFKPPGFRSGTGSFYSFSGHFGATADIYNHGGSSGAGGYGPQYGTHVIVQTGSTQNHDPGAWASYDESSPGAGDGTHTELVPGHGIGNFWDTLKLVDLSGGPITGGHNGSALQIAEVSYRTDVPTSFGPVDYQELIYEFWLPDYTGDFRVDWDQAVHGAIDTLRVDCTVAPKAAGGGSPFGLTAVPEPASVGLLGSAVLALVGVAMIRRRRRP